MGILIIVIMCTVVFVYFIQSSQKSHTQKLIANAKDTLNHSIQKQNTLPKYIRQLEQEYTDSITNIELAHENIIFKRDSIEVLRDYGLYNIPWEKLRTNGFTNIYQLKKNLHKLTETPGIGSKSKDKIQDALNKYLNDVSKSKLTLSTNLEDHNKKIHQLLIESIHIKIRLKKAQEALSQLQSLNEDVKIYINQLSRIDSDLQQSDIEMQIAKILAKSNPITKEINTHTNTIQTIQSRKISLNEVTLFWDSFLDEISTKSRRLTIENTAKAPIKTQSQANIQTQDISTESDFETHILSHFIESLGWTSQPQYNFKEMSGSQYKTFIVDQYIERDGEAFTLFESKKSISTERELSTAAGQARSYALHLGIGCFIVAAQEGLWVYSLKKGKSKCIQKFTFDDFPEQTAAFIALVEANA